ncbi:hypothetical protein VP01_5707g2, partial [Puccinia sorghi]
GASPSDRYTRLGFSCQMSEKMSNAVVACINTKNKTCKIVSGQQVQIDNSEAKLAKKKKKFVSCSCYYYFVSLCFVEIQSSPVLLEILITCFLL